VDDDMREKLPRETPYAIARTARTECGHLPGASFTFIDWLHPGEPSPDCAAWPTVDGPECGRPSAGLFMPASGYSWPLCPDHLAAVAQAWGDLAVIDP
jgi:hypothetical protein